MGGCVINLSHFYKMGGVINLSHFYKIDLIYVNIITMFIHCKKHNKDAFLPVKTHENGVFKLKLMNSISIEPKQTIVIDTGLQIQYNNSYTLQILSDENSLSKGLHIFSFSSLNTKTTDDYVPKLTYSITNNGKMSVTMTKGQYLGLMKITKGISAEIREVYTFEKGIPIVEGLEPIFKAQRPDVLEFAKNEMVWFKKLWRHNSDACRERWFIHEPESFIQGYNEMLESNYYLNHIKQGICRSNWAWNNITSETKKLIRGDYKHYKDSMINKIRN